MRKRKKKNKGSSFFQKILLILTGSLLLLCVASFSYGLFIRHKGGSGEASNFRIELLNGTGEKGLAGKVAVGLRKMGLDVFKVGNAESFSYGESVLIERKENEQFGLVAELLGCNNTIVQLKRESLVDATFILGSDYKKLNLGLGK